MTDVSFSGTLKNIDPKKLIKESENDIVSDFFLVLGLFYNDLKSLTFYLLQAENRFKDFKIETVDQATPSIEFGEWGGTKSHLQRLTIATLHEFFNFIQANGNVLKTGEFQLLRKGLNSQNKKNWDLLVQIARGEDLAEAGSEFAKILLVVRNNLGFHYQNPKLISQGFVQHFHKDPKNNLNKKAYFSIENNMNNTRFFYSDAAAERSTILQVEKSMPYTNFILLLSNTIDTTNFTLIALMKEYIKKRPN